MAKAEGESCKRPYDLGKRQETTSRTKIAVLESARTLLETGGVRDLTMEALARASGVTRQTIHNLFGTRSAVLEALFDQIALEAGIERMREVMMTPDPDLALAGFVQVFSAFWAKHRLLLRRIHGIAAVDPEFERAVTARNQRRQMAASRLMERFVARGPFPDPDRRGAMTAVLVALTSFEFFEALAESAGTTEAAVAMLYPLIHTALAP